ncbi:MAG: YCF48-related protein, partial [Acidobacteriota bacterium]|nr:YCF48-related protein [Acidobacteriota bacterium]
GLGVVERSADGGASWQQLPLGVETEMLAGAAPSASVCWLAGRGGVVLLTDDARTWRRIRFPASADLVDVQALDARVATVRTSEGAVFRTTNGGTNWTRVP